MKSKTDLTLLSGARPAPLHPIYNAALATVPANNVTIEILYPFDAVFHIIQNTKPQTIS
jgi:hypothetical protein